MFLGFLLGNILPLYFAAAPACTKPTFFMLPPWWEYLALKRDTLGQCAPVFNPPGDIWAIGLWVLDVLLRVVGFLAVVSIIIAGWQYIVAVGNADKITAARRRIVEALIGLGIALVATAVVSYLGRQFGP